MGTLVCAQTRQRKSHHKTTEESVGHPRTMRDQPDFSSQSLTGVVKPGASSEMHFHCAVTMGAQSLWAQPDPIRLPLPKLFWTGVCV